jgi:drug/metabolite transporter (DMT)-like permease
VAAPIGAPRPTPASEDWAGQAADTVVSVVDAVRDKTTGPILTAARAIVYGLIGLFAVIVALIVTTIALVRIVDVYLPGEVWSAHLLIGSIFTIAGFFVWTKRYAPDTSS